MSTPLTINSVETLEQALPIIRKAQELYSTFSQEQVDAICEKSAMAVSKMRIPLAKMACEETGYGIMVDKVTKNQYASEHVWNYMRNKKTCGVIEENKAFGTMRIASPKGVIAAITPTTNPTETIINNTISMIAGGNTVVFNVHPRAKRVSADCLQALNTAIIEAGGPANLITMTREPTMENVDKMAANPKIRLMAGTGGMGMVNALRRSGKKCIGAGAGNPPVIVDETADIELAGRKIYEGASFDNNILCFAEKEVFAVNTAYDGLLHELQKQGAYLLNKAQTEQLVNIVLQPKKGGGHEVNKKWVG